MPDATMFAYSNTQGQKGVVPVVADVEYGELVRPHTKSIFISRPGLGLSTAQYAANDTFGPRMIFTDAVRSVDGAGIIQTSTLQFMDTETPTIDLYLFREDVTPVGDNAAYGPTDADLRKCIGVLRHDTWRQTTAQGISTVVGIAQAFSTSGGRNLYGQMATRDQLTLGTTNDVSVELVILQD